MQPPRTGWRTAMAIVWVPGAGGAALVLMCDACDRPIRAARDGLALYEDTSPGGDVGRVRHAHRAGPCGAAPARPVGGRGRKPRAASLRIHLSVLVNNLGLCPNNLKWFE